MYLPGLKNEYPICGALHTHTQLVSYPFWAVFTTQKHSDARQMAIATTVAKKNQKHSYPCHTIPAHGHRGAGYAPTLGRSAPLWSCRKPQNPIDLQDAYGAGPATAADKSNATCNNNAPRNNGPKLAKPNVNES